MCLRPPCLGWEGRRASESSVGIFYINVSGHLALYSYEGVENVGKLYRVFSACFEVLKKSL